MTWEPKNGLNDEDVDVSDEEDLQEHSFKEEKSHSGRQIERQIDKQIKNRLINIWMMIVDSLKIIMNS